MPLELTQEGVVMRVDGDVLEIFQTGAGRGSDRVLLSWLAVRVLPSYKGHLVIEIKSTADVVPLYEVAQKARSFTTVTKLGIKIRGRARLPAVLHPGRAVVRPPRGALTPRGHCRSRQLSADGTCTPPIAPSHCGAAGEDIRPYLS